MSSLAKLVAKLESAPRLRRWGAVVLLLAAGWIDYLTGPELASAPFYLVILLALAFFEPWWACLPFAGLATLIYLGVDLLTAPGSATLIFPYWRAFARLLSFTLVPVAVSLLVGERRELQLAGQALQQKGLELEGRNRRLEETLREVERLQHELVERERQAAAAEALYMATYEMERPLASISVYVEESLRLGDRAPDAEEAHVVVALLLPLLEKIGERARDMEGILKGMRELRPRERGLA